MVLIDAGLIYLIVLATGILNLAYVPSQLMVPNDAAGIVTQTVLMGASILMVIPCFIVFLLIALSGAGVKKL